jgi:hypothetical protein
LVVATWLRRSGRLDEVAADVGVDYEEAVVAAEQLVAAGMLERSRTEDPATPARPSYRPATDVAIAIDRMQNGLGAAAGGIRS